MKSDDEVNEIALHVRQSSEIKFQCFWIRDSVINEKGPFQILNVFCFSSSTRKRVLLIVYTYYYEASQSTVAKQRAETHYSLVWYILTKGMFKMNKF